MRIRNLVLIVLASVVSSCNSAPAPEAPKAPAAPVSEAHGNLAQLMRAIMFPNSNVIFFVQKLRDAGMTAYKAAQSKNQDNILAATDTLTTACGSCHEKYRDKPDGVASRCM